ncbi:MAG: dimethyl sulfoxide reductase anchor subunit [Arcobacter sp.]|nr:dimethyl sulfoxide reductase anchor subunit [Arcobacter sp.]
MSIKESTPLESFINKKAQTDMQCGNYSIDIEKPKKGEQYRFHFDATACVGCHCCEVACNEQNNNPSDIKWRRVGETQSGIFPNVSNHFNSMSCNHCIDPECLKGCPTESYIKFDNGIVYHEDETCIGCQYCTWNCPYEVPVFNHNRGIVTKCHMCHEKLEVSETPACIQACPAGAIEIEVVNTKDWLNEGLEKEGIAPHLPDVNITKPTTRYTINEKSEEVIPADAHIIKPNHSELPLVFMTVLTQISLGGFAAIVANELINFLGFNLNQPNIWMILAVFIPVAIGLPLSALHLGRPILAHTAMKNIKTSWLSREALALGLYALGLTLLLIVFFFEFNQLFKLSLEIIILSIGIYGIYSQSMIYRIKARPSWNKKETTKIFFNVSYIGMLLVSIILIVNTCYLSASFLISIAIFISYLQYTEFTKESDFYKYLDKNNSNFYQLNKTKTLYEKNFKKHTLYREITLYIGALGLPLLTMLLIASENYTEAIILLSLAFVISFSSEIVSRLLFYKTAVAQGLAGNFFAGNQRT